MPTVGLNRTALFAALGKEYTEEEFDALCFEFGLELDEVVTEENGEVTYKIDIGANRYDLLCLEGIARNLLIFQGKMPIPTYEVEEGSAPVQRLVIERSTAVIRPHCVAATLRGVTLDQTAYDSFIDLQDKLHQNIARNRTLVAIGTHDLDTLTGPFTYSADPPKDIRFKPLNQAKEMSAPQMMELFSQDSHLKQYLHIIRDSPVYPVIRDSKGVVLSMPPIINGDHSKISLKTKNIFIECTGTDLTKTKVVLDTLVTMFSQHCKVPFRVERAIVEDRNRNNVTLSYPELRYRTEVVEREKVCGLVGVTLTAAEIAKLLSKMCLESKALDGDRIEVTIPPTRHDILHACDIYEDVAIAYGYNNLTKTVPKTMTVARQLPINKLSDQMRQSVAQAGFTETLTFSLCSRDDVSVKIRKSLDSVAAVHIANPKTQDFQVVRTTLLPGLLKTVHANKNLPLPLKVFEISDVVFRDPSKDVGARSVCEA